ncbi:MAG: 16S rRNA methyltransferase [Candidatus Thorarchaeota archaeon]|nr:16S rRNA methyltransferase [Candidatus Thorarchaeota archaeon]
MLHLILLDCGLELVPPELARLKEIQQFASKRRKSPREILLDQTHHGRSMTRLADGARRGRPDIVMHSLMAVLETPLCKAGLLGVHLHLLDGRTVYVSPDVRLPRAQDRFVGLMEQLLLAGQVPPDGNALLQLSDKTLDQLIRELQAGSDSALTLLAMEGGTRTDISRLAEILPSDPNIPVIVGVGAFPHGTFSDNIRGLFPIQIELDPEVMMAWHVCAEVLWTYSWKTGVSQRRYEGH